MDNRLGGDIVSFGDRCEVDGPASSLGAIVDDALRMLLRLLRDPVGLGKVALRCPLSTSSVTGLKSPSLMPLSASTTPAGFCDV